MSTIVQEKLHPLWHITVHDINTVTMFLLYYVDQECYTGALKDDNNESTLKRTKDDNNESTLSKQVFFYL